MVYLQELCDNYKVSGDLQMTLEATSLRLAEGLEHAGDMVRIVFSEPETNLVMSLINTGQNQKLLQNIPNRPFQDLSIVYRYVTSMDSGVCLLFW